MTPKTPMAVPVGRPAVTPPPVRFADLVAAEWIKIRSLRSTSWTLALVTLVVIGAAVAAAMADYNNFPGYSPETQREHPFSLHDAFPAAGYMSLMLAAGCVGAVTATGEYGSGLIRTTTVAVPARGAVVAAKAVVTAALWTVVGLSVAACSFAVSQTILSGRDAGITLGHPGAVRALVASALLAPVCALLGLGLGFLIRHSATAMVTTTFTLLMLPMFFSTEKRWSAEVRNMMVDSAWQRLTMDWVPSQADSLIPLHTATLTQSWVAYALWPTAAVALALVLVRRRDV
ncbi:ABC transporter permease [Streptomyces albireticuli]|nr:ABC transporter permease [Streptomyces albireticuli]MCD9143070.1 ABC transporter permease [Streptomyces albireticuli]MCD9165313.1 ABC transporter permease [Streptomyces albireticuli]MCD9192169.1 ABC transporter permease [Streptomyces albireticuli]